jgi:hypothetical protein
MFYFKQFENSTPGLFHVSKNFTEATSRKNRTPTEQTALPETLTSIASNRHHTKPHLWISRYQAVGGL